LPRFCLVTRACVFLTGAALVLAGCATSRPLLNQGIDSITRSCGDRLTRQSAIVNFDVESAGRVTPMTAFVPLLAGEYPLIGFSHGAFAAPDRYEAMLAPIASAGYIVVAPMHIDSEEMQQETPPEQAEVWRTRNADMQLALSITGELLGALEPFNVTIDPANTIAIGHSFGALMAQFTGGVQPVSKDGAATGMRVSNLAGVVAFSPPGPIPGTIGAEGWSQIDVPSLTLTGTGDVLPGFIDDWSLHKASFEHAPEGSAELWVGEGVDHYFGGVFGRVKPADRNSRVMFDRALAQTLGFIERNTGHPTPCYPGAEITGEVFEQN